MGSVPSDPARSDRKIAVVLVDDHPLYRDGVRRSLGEVDDIDVVGEATTGQEALLVLGRLAGRVDLVLLDRRMPGMDGLATARRISELYPEVGVIMLSATSDGHAAQDAAELGLRGYLLKHTRADELIDSIRAAAHGLTVTSASIHPTGGDDAGLTARQVEILTLMAAGKTNQEIAADLFVSVGTIKADVDQIMERLGVRARTAVVAEAMRRGLVE